MRLRYRNNGKRTVLVSRPFVMVNFDSSGFKVELLLADGENKNYRRSNHKQNILLVFKLAAVIKSDLYRPFSAVKNVMIDIFLIPIVYMIF